jgi:hypothetical protein
MQYMRARNSRALERRLEEKKMKSRGCAEAKSERGEDVRKKCRREGRSRAMEIDGIGYSCGVTRRDFEPSPPNLKFLALSEGNWMSAAAARRFEKR